jgi:glycosyltransferase involved in cell wall biosynthesis
MKRLLFLTPNPVESASERYRIYQFLPWLERAGFACTVWPFARRGLFRAIHSERLAAKLVYAPLAYLRRMLQLAAISHFDLVVVHRGIFPFPWPALEKALIRRHGKVVFDFDDAIYAGHQNTENTKYPWLYKLKYGPQANETLALCAQVIAGNRTLAEHSLRFNEHVSTIPTVVDLEQYAYRPPSSGDGLLTIGWVGSRSTSPYLLAIEPALRRLSETYPGRIRFRLYGHPQRKLALPNFASLPFSLASEVADLRSIDIGIMPMPDNEWTRGKCAFKAIQYMALGIPTVASPVGMAAELVENDVSGLWARTPEEWFGALQRLVAEPQLRTRLAVEGRKTVAARYSLETWAPRLTEVLEQVLQEPSPLSSPLGVLRAGS